MDFGSLLLLIALCIPVVLYIARPLFERKSATNNQLEHDRSHWLAERDRTLNALQELDFDYNLGKIPEEDYPTTRAWMVQRGAEILRKLDEIQPAVTPIRGSNVPSDSIEAAITSRRMGRTADSTLTAAGSAPVAEISHGKNVILDDSIETLIADRRRQHNGKTGGFCHKCGGTVHKDDLFCPKCGAKLKSAT